MDTNPKLLAERLVKLIPADDDRMWHNTFAGALEAAAEADDLTLLRIGRQADDFEAGLQRFAVGFPGLELTPPPEGGFYAAAIALAKLDSNARGAALKTFARKLRDQDSA